MKVVTVVTVVTVETVVTKNLFQKKTFFSFKLDGVGPVDNRPSTDKLQHFVKKKRTCDM